MDLLSEVRTAFIRQWKAASRNLRLQIVLAFILPVIAFVIATDFDPDSSSAIAAVGANEADSVRVLSSMFKSDHVLSNISAIREILSNHLDLFFIGALIAGKMSVRAFALSVLMRTGLSSAATFLFLRKRVRTSAAASILLAFCYSTLPPAMTYGVIPAVGNLMIMLPLVMYAEDVYLCNNSLRNFMILTAAIAVMILTGPYGVLCGLPFALGAGLLMAMCRTGSVKKILVQMGGMIPSCLLASGLCAIVLLPRFYNADTAPKPESNKIRYTFFDMLSSMLDGKVPSSVSVSAPAFSMGIFVLMLILLFFLNGVIPFRVKLVTGTFIVLAHVSAVVPVVDRLVSVYDDHTFAVARLIGLSMILIFSAAVSLRNISRASESDVRIAEVLILALIVITNSSANETSPSEFTLFFSAAAAVISGGLLLKHLRGSRAAVKVLCCIAVLGMGINLWHVAPKIIGTRESLSAFDSGNLNVSTVEMYEKDVPSEDIPLYGNSEENGYLLVTADLSYLEPSSIPDALNSAARSALLANVYDRISYNVIYNHGASPYGGDFFTFDPSGGQCELIAGIKIDETDRCIVSSGLDARVFLTESYTASDRMNSYSGPFLYEFTPDEALFSIRYATTPADVRNGSFSVWIINDDALNVLREAVKPFDGKVIEGGDSNWMMSYTGKKSVITSVSYDPAIRATVGGRKAQTYNYCGLLAVLFESDGSGIMPEIRLTSDKGDLIIGAMISTVSLGIMLAPIYIHGSKKRDKEKSGAAT